MAPVSALKSVVAASVLSLLLACVPIADACTGITLRAKDGAVVYGRTMEWGTFDLHSRVSVIPRGLAYTGATPDKQPGIRWTAKYGVVALDGLGKDIVLDGMNERGLTVGLFYHPGFAEYPEYDRGQRARTLGPTDSSGCRWIGPPRRTSKTSRRDSAFAPQARSHGVRPARVKHPPLAS